MEMADGGVVDGDGPAVVHGAEADEEFGGGRGAGDVAGSVDAAGRVDVVGAVAGAVVAGVLGAREIWPA